MEALVSIIIPCYNGANYIAQTLASVINQDYNNVEIIVIDDGSTDDSKQIIHTIADDRITYIYQTNKGVADARNAGFAKVKGKYIVFFDADDIMGTKFISSRVYYLQTHTKIDFVSGDVQQFSDAKIIHKKYNGISNNGTAEILLYTPSIATCPSNYIFVNSFLVNNNIKFNVRLSSTADRFFLLQCIQLGTTVCTLLVQNLQYRVSTQSMSHTLTASLVTDNENYYAELKKHKLMPNAIKHEALFLEYFILAGANWKINNTKKAIIYFVKCAFTNPIKLTLKLINKLF